MFVGAVLSIAAFFLIRHDEQRRIEREFEWRTHSHFEGLRTNLHNFEECLYTLRDLFQSHPSVSYPEFVQTASDLRARHRGVQMLQWIPRILAEDRASFEAAARTSVTPDYQIQVKTKDARAYMRAPEFPEYAPVYYVDPRQGNEVAFGFDDFHGTQQQVAFDARDRGVLSASRRVPLRGGSEKEFGWLYFLPVYDQGVTPGKPSERRERLRGYLEGSFLLGDLLADSFHEFKQMAAVDALLMDETAGNPQPFLISFVGGVGDMLHPLDPANFLTGIHRTESLEVGGRKWRIYYRPSPAWLHTLATPYPYVALILGLFVTGLTASLVHHVQQRALVIGRLVEERTAELHATQDSLREDIRRREIVERALQQSEDRYRDFLAQSTEAIWRFELEPPIPVHMPIEEQVELLYRTGRLAECNDAMARMHGHTRADVMLGKSIEEFAPRDEPQNSLYFRAFIENGYHVVDWETREVDKDGRNRFFLTNETGIVEDDLLKRIWRTQRDITERKREAEAQMEQATRLRLAVTAANLGTWDWDLRTERVIWPPETERMFGLETGSFDGKVETYLSYLHPEDRQRVEMIVRHALQSPGETGTDYELRIIRPDGTMRWIVARGAILRDALGKPFRMLGTVMDVTAEHHAEEERARMESKLQETQKLESLGILAGGIAHDFNNLLTGILGNANLARLDLPPNSPAQPSLEQIEVASQRAADLCKQMLAYSGKGRFIVQRLDLNSLVRETSELLQISIHKMATLNYSLAPSLPPIHADGTQIRQIIMNLVINASEAIGENNGVITIATGVMHADRAYLTESHLSPNIPEGEYVFLEVSDNGCGMSTETRARIFDPFFTTKFTGRGLGLAAVLGIVRGHQGALKVYSEVGRGTSFKLLLPKAEGAIEDTTQPTAMGPAWRGSGTMLVVDDEESVRTTTARMLERLGFQCLLAADGRQALLLFEKKRALIAGVLLDLTMPKLDGTATFTELRRMDPKVRVVLMSGFNEQDAINRFAGKGLAGFVQKPFKFETLCAKLEAVFQAA